VHALFGANKACGIYQKKRSIHMPENNVQSKEALTTSWYCFTYPKSRQRMGNGRSAHQLTNEEMEELVEQTGCKISIHFFCMNSYSYCCQLDH